MLNVTNTYKQAILSDTREFKLRCKINKKSYTEDDIQTMNWSGGAISGETFAIGSTVAADAKITFSRIVEGIAEEQEFEIDIGLVLPSGIIEYIPLGVFIVTNFDQKRNDNQTIVEGMDRFIMMEGIYDSKLTYPARIKDIAVEIANLSGIKINTGNFERIQNTKVNKPEGYTLRQAIGLIAQFQAGFACFNRQGELEIRQLTDPKYELKPVNYYSKGLVKNEVPYRIGGIQVKTGKEDEILTAGKRSGSQILLDNKIMTRTLLSVIYNSISNTNFYPFNLKWQGDPALEAGDWITIIDLKGNKFKVPNLSYSFTFNGGLSAVSSATQKSVGQASYQYRGGLNQLVNDIHGWISAGGGNWTYEGLDIPANPKEGDTWFKPNGPDMEIWRYEKLADGSFDWVMKTSTAGITEAQEAAEKAAEMAENAAAEAETALNNANDAVYKANQLASSVESIRVMANEASNDANRAYAEATQALSNSGAALINALNAQRTASGAVADAKKALEDVEGVKTTVSTEVSRIDGLLATKVNETEYNALKGTVDSHTTTMEQQASEIALKANQSLVDTINQTVKDLNSELTIQAGKIAAKANQIDVDLINQTVKDINAELTVQAGKIEAKANQSSVDLLNNRVEVTEASLSVQANEISGLVTKTDGLVTDVNSLVLSTERFSVNLSKLETHVEEVAGANANLWGDRNTTIGAISGSGGVFGGAEGDSRKYTEYIRIQNATHISYRCYGRIDPTTTGAYTGNYAFYDSNKKFLTGIEGAFQQTNNNLLGKTLQVPDGAFYVRFSLDTKFKHKVEWGETYTPWCPSIGDQTDLIQYSTFLVTVDSIQMAVANKAEASYVVQLANQITSVVGDIDSITNNGQDIVPYFERGAINGTTGAETAHTTWVRSPFVRVAGGTDYLFFNGVLGTTVIQACYWYWYDENHVFLERSYNTNGKATAPASAVYLRLCFANAGPPEDIERSLIAGTTPVKITPINRSQITQLQNAINLRVQADKIINQINLSPESILIAGNKLRITADTYIANGIIGTAHIKDAAITNAKIGNISADKVNAGTLNAANVNIINLNVNKLTGNISTFIQSYWNAISSSLSIDGNGLYVGGSKKSLELNSSGMHMWDGINVGRIRANTWANSNHKGLVFNLETAATYMTWSYRENTTDESYTAKLTWMKANYESSLGMRKGFTFSDQVRFREGIRCVDANTAGLFLDYREMDGAYGVMLSHMYDNKLTQNGLFFTDGEVRLLIGNTFYRLSRAAKVGYALYGLGTICLPTIIRQNDGTVANWKIVTL